MAKYATDNVNITYISGREELLDDVKVLWEELNLMLKQGSIYFKSHYDTMTYKKRKNDLQRKAAGGEMRVTLAVNQKDGRKIGYCVSTFNRAKIGEIESIFVVVEYRGKGVGETLINDALVWMEAKAAIKKLVAFSAGNEKVSGFYERYGFRPRRTVMERLEQI